MHQPNVIGDWREYEDDHKGIRVRVHSLKKGDIPPEGRDSDAKGLTYFSFRVTVENRAEEWFEIKLERRHIDVRAGRDGDSVYLDYNSREIEGFKLYPLRRASATFYAAAPARRLDILDIQIRMRIDDEPSDPQVWVGGADVPEAATRTSKKATRAKDSLANEVSKYLQEQGDA
ncbi:hypothetical protein SAM9427_05260 [Streptomyces sp. ETH9427]|uniref:hypothetical protein n=1 Tax=unclassified Streptomyces TaxID=2593676 RepID=UPI000E0C6496|nr:hypothetical protein [Streptomyces sp. E1N211]AXI85383.1 hypothetical protein SAM9427_05260 [Streptomyces sp. ETH9427]